MGEDNLSKSVGISSLAKRCEKNSERDCQRIMVNQFGLSLPLEKHRIPVDENYSLPVLSLSEWARFLVLENHWHLVVGLHRPNWEREDKILQKFWSCYQLQNPGHMVFEMARRGEIDLAKTAPFVAHGDEGRGRKNCAFLVLSFHSLLGKGIAAQRRSRTKKPPFLKMWCNYEGHTYTSRFLMAAVAKHLYTNANSKVFDDLMHFASTEANNMLTTGVSHPIRGNFRIAVLNVVGDWPWLVKSGGLERSFMNVKKHKETAGQARRPQKGVCHLCSAGKNAGIDGEQIGTRKPAWLDTMYIDDPFRQPLTPWLSLPHQRGEAPALFHYDVFHTFHLGCGKAVVASVLVLLAEQRPETNIDARMSAVSDDYLRWCKNNRKRAYISKLTKEALNYTSTNCFPNAGWHKGDLTTTMMEYLEDRFRKENWSDQLLRLSGEAVCAANECLRTLYRGELWLEPCVAKQASELGLKFLRRYGACARAAVQNARTLFVLQPKLHAWHHLMLSLLYGSQRGPTLNVLAFATQPSEDFLGRPSRLSRRVTASDKCSDRVIDRYLRACFHQWVKAGIIVTTKGM